MHFPTKRMGVIFGVAKKDTTGGGGPGGWGFLAAIFPVLVFWIPPLIKSNGNFLGRARILEVPIPETPPLFGSYYDLFPFIQDFRGPLFLEAVLISCNNWEHCRCTMMECKTGAGWKVKEELNLTWMNTPAGLLKEKTRECSTFPGSCHRQA